MPPLKTKELSPARDVVRSVCREIHLSFSKTWLIHTKRLNTGCRWCDVPRGPQWASKSATHRWLRRWQTDGTLAAMQARILGVAEEKGLIRWEYGAVDGAFSPWQ